MKEPDTPPNRPGPKRYILLAIWQLATLVHIQFICLNIVLGKWYTSINNSKSIYFGEKKFGFTLLKYVLSI